MKMNLAARRRRFLAAVIKNYDSVPLQVAAGFFFPPPTLLTLFFPVLSCARRANGLPEGFLRR